MPIPSQELHIRPAQEPDAAAMNALHIDRLSDAVPGYEAQQADRIAWFRQFGDGRFRRLIRHALGHPSEHYCNVAAVGGEVVGFSRAEAPASEPFTWWRGLVVARQVEGLGVGSALEQDRTDWAKQIGRPVRVNVVSTNLRSLDFLGRQGFVVIDSKPADTTDRLPMTLLELNVSDHQE